MTDRLEIRRLAVAGAIGQTRFENIAATSPDGIICADHHGDITFWNAACERLFGFNANEAVGKSLDIIVPERMRGGHGGGLQRVAAGGKPRLVGTTVELDAARQDGSEFPIELSLSMWREADQASFGAIIRDIGERRANQTRLFNLAHLDSLTGLPNRAVLLNRIDERAKTELLAILMVDLDGFKNVNDTLGHTAGDAVLRQVAARILGCVRPIDTVARLGGDEFAILMPDSPDRAAVGATADCIIAAIGVPCVSDGQMAHIGASIGIAFGPKDGEFAEDLLSAADLAMYQAKGEGRNCRRFFAPPLREAAINRRAFEGELRRAIDENEFELFYQPQVRMAQLPNDEEYHSRTVLGTQRLSRFLIACEKAFSEQLASKSFFAVHHLAPCQCRKSGDIRDVRNLGYPRHALIELTCAVPPAIWTARRWISAGRLRRTALRG